MLHPRNLAFLVATFLAHLSIPVSAHAAACGSHVHWSGSSATVQPSHGDDTAALQCVFTALAGVSGAQVKLVAGTYTTGNLIIRDFDGVFIGAGSRATTITNGVVRVATNFFENDPSLENPWPLLLTFIGGRFQVSDLGFAIGGASPTTWTLPGLPVLHSLAVVAAVLGEVDARFVRVRVTGERAPEDPVFGFNLYNGIVFQGPAVTPASGKMSVEDCSFQTVGSWAPIADVQHGTFTATGNDSDDLFFAFDVGPLQDTRALYAGNRVRHALVSEVFGTLDRSSLSLVANDVESSAEGIQVTMDFTNGASCSIVGNKLATPDPAILLGPGTSHCLVAGNHGASVIDQGTNNLVVQH